MDGGWQCNVDVDYPKNFLNVNRAKNLFCENFSEANFDIEEMEWSSQYYKCGESKNFIWGVSRKETIAC